MDAEEKIQICIWCNVMETSGYLTLVLLTIAVSLKNVYNTPEKYIIISPFFSQLLNFIKMQQQTCNYGKMKMFNLHSTWQNPYHVGMKIIVTF